MPLRSGNSHMLYFFFFFWIEMLYFFTCALVFLLSWFVLIKASLFCLRCNILQSAMPEDALIGAWKKSAHRLWAKRLRRSSTLSEITQVSIYYTSSLFFGVPYFSSD